MKDTPTMPQQKVMMNHHLNANTCHRLKNEQHAPANSFFRIITQLGGFEEMGKKCAICIYCGMMTDTGGFTYKLKFTPKYSTSSANC